MAAQPPAATPQPLIATQRYGQGRSMVFAGEASWRWRMMRPATDTSYETIWRQLARWLDRRRAGPVTIAPMSPAVPGVTDRISVIVRDEEFGPVANAEVAIALTAPDGAGAHAGGGAGRSAGRALCGGGAVRSAGRLPVDAEARARRLPLGTAIAAACWSAASISR